MPPESIACDTCVLRSATLAMLSARIDHAARSAEDLKGLLDLHDELLIEAIGGRRRQELRRTRVAQRSQLRCDASSCPPSTCLHAEIDGETRSALERIPGVPSALRLAGGAQRLRRALGEPVVLIEGSRRASDYGLEVARSLARGLSAAGLTVAAPFADGVAAAALAGAVDGGRPPLAMMPGGLEVCRPACLRPLHRRLLGRACVLSQMPDGFQPRRWSARAAGALLAGLASAIVVVEAREERELLAVRIGASLGRPIAAVPGRITSPGAWGPHLLLAGGATLLTGAEGLLDLLYDADQADAARRRIEAQAGAEDSALGRAALGGFQREVLDRIGSGQDTLGRLAAGPDAPQTLLALAELETAGLVVRGDGGRYLPRLGRNIQ